ncbi:hypothetical protein [Salmonella phage PHA46]
MILSLYLLLSLKLLNEILPDLTVLIIISYHIFLSLSQLFKVFL